MKVFDETQAERGRVLQELEQVLAQAWDCVRHDQFEKAYETFSTAFNLATPSATDLTERRAEALYGQALGLRKLGRRDEALKKLEDLRGITPSYAPFLVKEALLYIDKEQHKKAVEPFAKGNGSNVEMLREMLFSIREPRPCEDIEKVIEAALELFPGDPGIRSEYGWLKFGNEEYDEAIEKFNKVLADKTNETLKAEKYKGYESALQGKLASLRLTRQYEAHKLLSDPTVIPPDHYGIQAELGWCHFDQKLFNKARKIFEEIYSARQKFALQWIISCYRSVRDFAKAEEWIQTGLAVLHDDPARIGIQNEKGWLFVDKRQYGEALKAFDEVLKVNKSNQFALQGKIASLRLQGRFPEATKVADEALTLHPESTGILSERGWLFFDQKRFVDSEAEFAKAITEAPYRIELEFSRVEVLLRMHRSFEAEKALHELKRRFPNDPQVMERLGRFYIYQKDLRRAERELESALENNADYSSARGGLGAVYLVESRYDDAIECFRNLLKMEPYNPAWYTNLAWALVRKEATTPTRQCTSEKRFAFRTKDKAADLSPLDEAERLCEKALEADPDSCEAYGCLGTIAFKRGKPRFSEDYLRMSIRKDSLRGNYVGLGALLVQMGRYDEAEEVLKEALLNQDDVAVHVEFGNLFLKTGRTKEAIHEFRRAMAIDPADEDPPRALSIALMEANQINEAEAVLRDALKRLDESKRWRLHLTHAQLLIKRGEETEYSHYYNEAFKEVKKAINLNPANADPYFYAGFIRAKVKDYKGARKYFNSCLKRDNHHDEAESNLTHVRSLIREEKERSRTSFWAGFCLGALAVSNLVLLWYDFLKQGRVTETILSVLLPILLGLVVIAFLIPVLHKLKLPGLEAELRDRKDPVTSALKGEVVFSTLPPTISSGPR